MSLYTYIVYHNQCTVTIALCIVGPLRPSKYSKAQTSISNQIHETCQLLTFTL